jgi:hypothetical protein
MNDLQKIQEFFSKSLEETKIEYLNPGKRPIITNKQGEKFVLQGFVTSGYYLIPYNGKKYWEHFSVPKNQWISEKNINWSDYNFSEEQFNNLKASNLDSKKEIDKKFQDMKEAKSEDGYEVVWTDRNYNEYSKIFKNDPLGPPENARTKAEKFAKKLEIEDKKSTYGNYRSINIKSLYKELNEIETKQNLYSSISNSIPEDTSYIDLAKVIAKILKEDYGSHNFKSFVKTLVNELKN